LEAAIEYVFQRVAVRVVRVHPCVFLRVIDSGFLGSDKSLAKCATRQQPPELYAEEQKEAEDVTREIFVLLDSATSPSRVISWNKIASKTIDASGDTPEAAIMWTLWSSQNGNQSAVQVRDALSPAFTARPRACWE
jgi:hypothetical protein